MIKHSADMQTADDEITDVGERLPAPKAARRPRHAGRSRFRVPRSSLINFCALLLLFGGIFLIRQFGDVGPTVAAARQTAHPEIAPVELSIPSLPAVISEEPISQMPATVFTAENATIPAEKPLAAPETQVAAPLEPTPERPHIDRRTVEEDRRAVKRYEARKTLAPSRGMRGAFRDAYEDDRRFPLSELDNEAARQGYLAANREASGGHEKELTPSER